MDDALEKTFSEIYETGTWGTGSGPGSAPAETIGYRAFLQEFMLRNEVKRVADVGCGDWQFSRHLDFTGIEYTGVDIVPAVIESNRAEFGSDHIRFEIADGGFESLPAADLLIAKDVLQHLNTRTIQSFLGVVDRYPFVLVTNCMEPVGRTNAIIKNGAFRPVDLRRKPFGRHAAVVYTFYGFAGRQEVHLLTTSTAAAQE